jgi:hypothetical protein
MSRDKAKRIESRDSNWYLNGHINVINKSQKVKTTQASINGQMDNQIVIYTNNGRLV